MYKPLGISSHTLVSRVRGITKIKKAGHAGTLDPLADGVLPVLLGRATKISELILSEDKWYRAQMRLGMATDTCDMEGEVLSRAPVTVSAVTVKETVSKFVGEISQTPPMFSAVRMDGVRLYELARDGVEVERKERSISIFSIEVETIDEIEGDYALKVHCSKGTYIRTLVDDIGKELGCGGVLSGLTRTYCAGFELSKCITLEQLSEIVQSGRLAEYVVPVDVYFSNLEAVTLIDFYRHLIINGCEVTLKKLRVNLGEGKICRLYGKEDAFLGIGKVEMVNGVLCMKLQIGF